MNLIINILKAIKNKPAVPIGSAGLFYISAINNSLHLPRSKPVDVHM